MKYELAENAGYCFGVKHAIDLVDDLVEHTDQEQITTLGELSHNKQEMERLESLGVKQANSVDEVEDGILIIRTHGTTRKTIQEAQDKGLHVIDATCPFVKELQNKIEKYDSLGYQIVIVGDKNHPEVQGACGWASHAPIVIDSTSEIEKLDGYDKICIVAQTTMIEEKFKKIAEVLTHKSRDILIFNTICSATVRRQQAAAELADRVDGMIVVGGYHSSNTQKLVEICKAHCKNTWHVETAQELDFDQLKKCKVIGISAGASTPDWLIEEVTQGMEENKFDQTVVAENVEPETEVTETEVVSPETESEAVEQVTEDTQDEAVASATEETEVDNTQDDTVAEEAENIDVEVAPVEDTEPEKVVINDEVDVTTEEEPLEEPIGEIIGQEEVTEIEAAEAASEEASEQEVEEQAAADEIAVTEEKVQETVESPVSDIVFNSPEDNAKLDEEFDFEAELDNSIKPVRKNTVIEGEVLHVSDDEVIINIGAKSDAVIFKKDFTWKRDEDLQELVKPGDMITAIVTDLNDGEGRVKLSKIKYDNQQVQQRLGKAFETKETLYGKVKDVSGSGLIVDVGFTEIFMPASQYQIHYVKDLEKLIGTDVRGRIIDYNAKRRRAILSQKVILQEERAMRQQEQEARKEKRFNELQIDDIVQGKIKTITDFGVFVDLEGIDGFVHRSDLTWDRANDPRSVVEKGQEIQAKVISRNEDDKKIKLSIKALQEKPWDKFIKSYAENDEIDVIITNTLDFGAFAQIIPGVEGLIHISEISYDRVESVKSVLEPGSTVRVKIIGINADKEKISLSIKATLPRPERPQKAPRPQREDYEYYDRPKRNNKGGRKNNNRRNQSNKNRMVYEESAEFTLGDSFGDLFNNFTFDDYEDEEE